MPTPTDHPALTSPPRLDAVIEALLAGVAPHRIGEALGVSMVDLCELLASAEARERVQDVRRGLKPLLTLRLDGLRQMAAANMEQLLRRGPHQEVSAAQARSLEVHRRACVSVLRLDPDRPARWREAVDRSDGAVREAPETDAFISAVRLMSEPPPSRGPVSVSTTLNSAGECRAAALPRACHQRDRSALGGMGDCVALPEATTIEQTNGHAHGMGRNGVADRREACGAKSRRDKVRSAAEGGSARLCKRGPEDIEAALLARDGLTAGSQCPRGP